MGKLSLPVVDLVRKFKLNQAFFEANSQKADLWFLEAQKLILNCESENLAVVANTGAGKTVIALLVQIMADKRTIFVVPNKQLAFEQQTLFYAMGGKSQTKVITGNLVFHDRIWDDEDDRIIFATASVIEKEIGYGELNLDWFDMLVGDEIHNASSDKTAFVKIFQMMTTKKLWRLGLTASPGNTPEKILAIRQLCQLDGFVKFHIPTSGVVTSVIFAEQAKACLDINYIRAEELVISELERSLELVGTTSMRMSLGKKLAIDPRKVFKRKDIDNLRKQIHSFGKLQLGDVKDQKLAKRLASNLEQYAFWAHVYELFKAESFTAIKYYYQNNLMKKTTAYTDIIIKRGSAQMLLALTNGLTHPKEEILGELMLSSQRRDIQAIVFESNKATAVSDCLYLQNMQLSTDCIYSGKGMTPTVIGSVLQKVKDKEISSLITTDVIREGHNLSVEMVVHRTPPTHPIQRIQRDGRAGRGGVPAEIIFIVCEHEQGMIPAVSRQVKRLEQMDYSKGVMAPLRSRKTANPEQMRLFY